MYVPCEVCGGKRYNRETLEVKYKGKSIYDVLDMTVEEALEFFKNVPTIHRKIQTLYDVGLSYIKLGQPSTELSGGEAQRIKLATELSKREGRKTAVISLWRFCANCRTEATRLLSLSTIWMSLRRQIILLIWDRKVETAAEP